MISTPTYMTFDFFSTLPEEESKSRKPTLITSVVKLVVSPHHANELLDFRK